MKKKKVADATRYEIETFRAISDFEIRQLSQPLASCMNGMVRVRKWRVVAELIDEPIDIIAERIRKLWRDSDNHHDYHPLKNAAVKIGIVLDHEDFGAWRKK